MTQKVELLSIAERAKLIEIRISAATAELKALQRECKHTRAIGIHSYEDARCVDWQCPECHKQWTTWT